MKRKNKGKFQEITQDTNQMGHTLLNQNVVAQMQEILWSLQAKLAPIAIAALYN